MAETRLNVKQVLLTAVITCVFTVIAGVITYFITSKEASLSYSIATGPVLSSQGTHKRIFSLEVINSGRKEVLDASANIKLKDALIEEVAFEGSPGITLSEDRKKSTYTLCAATLNPKEHFSISLLISMSSVGVFPEVAVRGKGVSGYLRDNKKKDEKSMIYLVAGSAAALLGVFVSVSPLLRRKIMGHNAVSTVLRSFRKSGTEVGPFDRNELVAYILGLCSLHEHSRRVRFAPSEMSYRGCADYIVSEAIGAAPEEKAKFVTALKCMLLIGRINLDSVEVIKHTLQKMSQTKDEVIKELCQRALDPDDEPVKLREAIVDLITSEIV